VSLVFLIDLTAGFAGCEPPQPRDAGAIPEMTISEIHAAFEKGQLTSEQLVRFYIGRIAALGGSRLNSDAHPIDLRLSRRTATLWLHSSQLEISGATIEQRRPPIT
jgi:hypothetical protein